MSQFMKDKPKEKFYETPPIPADVKALIEQRKREEIEKLEKAEEAGRSLGVNYTPTKINRDVKEVIGGEDTGLTLPVTTTPDNETPPPIPPRSNSTEDKTKPPVTKPADNPAKKPETPAEKPKPEAPKKKGKKGDDGDR
jgi:hypothetical protein